MRLPSLLRRPPIPTPESTSQHLDTVQVHSTSVPIRPEDIAALDAAPAWLTPSERLMLFTLIASLRPSRYLEIGSFKGGSALIVNAAMDASENDGCIICVDPEPRISPEHRERLEGRGIVVEGLSPAILDEASEAAGGPFDFVFIDGDHTAEGVLRDAEGVLPHLADQATLLFHDAFNPDVDSGIQRFFEKRPRVVDCGVVTREVSYEQDGEKEIPWGGLRMALWRGGAP